MSLSVYDIGDRPEMTVTFRNSAGTATNPGAVTGKLRTPDGTETTLSAPVNSGTGVYVWTLPALTSAGWHTFRANGTSGLVESVEVGFHVRMSAFTSP